MTLSSGSSSTSLRRLVFLTIFSAIIGFVAMPTRIPVEFELFGYSVDTEITRPTLDLQPLGIPFYRSLDLQFGLDIQGGTRITLNANMGEIEAVDRLPALESAREIVSRRVDLYGVNESVVRTSVVGDSFQVVVELPGVTDLDQAVSTIGTTAQLEFRKERTAEGTQQAIEEFKTGFGAEYDSLDPQLQAYLEFTQQFEPTALTGKELERATVQFDPTTREPTVALEFTAEGRALFAEITSEVVGRQLAIFLDDLLISAPIVNTPILDGNAVISGGFDIETAKELVIQLNAGALPVPLEIVEQETIEASIGQAAVEQTAYAGVIGLLMIATFMVLIYGVAGFLAVMALVLYGGIMITIFKLVPVTLTMPGIAGLLLSIGMAVDSNVLIFERMKEELRKGRAFGRAMEIGFGKAWEAIREANLATLFICFVLFNPFDLDFLARSGSVRGFALTLALGVFVSMFTGLVVSRTLLRFFLADPKKADEKDEKDEKVVIETGSARKRSTRKRKGKK